MKKFFEERIKLDTQCKYAGTYSLISEKGESLNIRLGYFNYEKSLFVPKISAWYSEKYHHDKGKRPATKKEWIDAAQNWQTPIVQLSKITGNGTDYREACLLAALLGVEEYKYYTGKGSDDIGAGVVWSCFTKCFLFPVMVNQQATLHLCDKYRLGEEKMLKGWTGYDKVTFVNYDYDGFLAWVKISQIDSQGKEYNSLTGHVFSHQKAYIDTKERIWSWRELEELKELPAKGTAILWGSTGWGEVSDKVGNSEKYKTTNWIQDCYGGINFPNDVQF